MKASPSDVAAALIVCALALVALARSDLGPRPAPQLVRPTRPAPSGVGVDELRRGEPLDLNRAVLGDLVLLPGIGPKLAQRILDERARRGGFDQLEELRSVKGVGPATLTRLRGLVRVSSPRSASP